MKQYMELVRHIKDHGNFKEDRTGTGTYSVFGYQMRFDLSKGFPLVTAKHTHLKSIIHELLWFLKGETNIRYLKENGVRIWDEWVLKGTAEYRPMTEEEIKAAIVKAYEKINTEAKYQYQFIILPATDPVFSSVTKTPDEMTVYIEYKSIDALKDLYKDLYPGKEPKVLIGGELGPVYGSQWRSWPTREGGSIDQIKNLIDTLKGNPDSRRAIVTAWNPAEVDSMALPPCHALFQFYSAPMRKYEIVKQLEKLKLHTDFVRDMVDAHGADTFNNWLDSGSSQVVDKWANDYLIAKGVMTRKLSCQLYQRSADVFLGAPFNIASYALLTTMIAQVTNHALGEFIWTGGDCHLYANHMKQVNILLSRKTYPLPTMKINPEVKDIFSFKFDDFELLNYQHGPVISAPVAV